MGECAVGTDLDLDVSPLQPARIPRTMLSGVQRAIAEQTVKVLQSLMTREILTVSIFKKTIGIFHCIFPRFSL